MWSDAERSRLGELLDALVPGVAELGGVAYVEALLTALDHDPPRLWAGGDGWIPVGPWERAAWTERLAGWRAAYDRLLDGTGTDADRRLAHEHACEAAYGDPVYGGNREAAGWTRIQFPHSQYPPFFVGSGGTAELRPTKSEGS